LGWYLTFHAHWSAQLKCYFPDFEQVFLAFSVNLSVTDANNRHTHSINYAATFPALTEKANERKLFLKDFNTTSEQKPVQSQENNVRRYFTDFEQVFTHWAGDRIVK